MERVQINLPNIFSFSTIIHIRITDLNYGGHVGNDSFLSLIHEARQQFLKHHGYTELSFAGFGLIMADAAIEFKKEMHYSDAIKISVAANGFDKVGFDIFYLLEIIDQEKNIVSGKAKTGMMCYDYGAKKRVAVPEEAIIKLSSN